MQEDLKNLLRQMQFDLKLESRPFKRIAKELDCPEEEVIERIKDAMDQGYIRRIGAAVKPDKMGQNSNALVAWEIPEERVDEIGEKVAEMKEISHCYDRECPEGWEYNFFTMIHASRPEQLEDITDRISTAFGLNNYKIFKTKKELKKTSMKYFRED